MIAEDPKRRMLLHVGAVAALAACGVGGGVSRARAAERDGDPWAPMRRLIGDWRGTSSGKAGNGTVQRQYAFVLGGTFIRETNRSEYPPQPGNPGGEVHEHLSIFSFDKARNVLVLRQFHTEGFVNAYRSVEDPSGGKALVFESESFENLSNLFRARESYSFVSDDEFVETFELAPPAKPFAVYSTTRLRRS